MNTEMSCIELINFTIPGNPKPLKRHRSTRGGRMYDPSSRDKKEIWIQIAKYKPKQPLKGDIYMKAIFYMPRPKYHFKQKAGKPSNIIKDRYKEIRFVRVKPDLDNLIKMIADILQPQMICDDSQICILQAEKVYGEPRTEITIEELP